MKKIDFGILTVIVAFLWFVVFLSTILQFDNLRSVVFWIAVTGTAFVFFLFAKELIGWKLKQKK